MSPGSGMRSYAIAHPLTTFCCLAIGLGWLVALPLVLSPAGLGLIALTLPEEWIVLFTLTPTVAALWTQWLITGNFRICRLGSPWTRVLGASALGIAVALLALAVIPALVLSNGAVGALQWPAVLTASAGWWFNPFNLLGGPLTEEPGWRGFALPRLQERHGPLMASLILGLIWAGWHAPLFLVQGWLTVPIWAFLIITVCVSVLITCVVNFGRGSIVPAVLTHGVYNSSFAIVVGLCRGVPTREPGLAWYVAGIVVATLLMLAITRGRLGLARS